MTFYDPDWHKYEPTQDEVLTDAQREARNSTAARGWRRLLARVPWPLRIIPPFVAALGLPVVLLAVVFGSAADLESPAMTEPKPMSLSATFRTTGFVPLALSVQSFDFDLAERGANVLILDLRNMSADTATYITVDGLGLPEQVRLIRSADFIAGPTIGAITYHRRIAPGESATLTLSVGRLNIHSTGHYVGNIVVASLDR